jgi:hypothetical protein
MHHECALTPHIVRKYRGRIAECLYVSGYHGSVGQLYVQLFNREIAGIGNTSVYDMRLHDMNLPMNAWVLKRWLPVSLRCSLTRRFLDPRARTSNVFSRGQLCSRAVLRSRVSTSLVFDARSLRAFLSLLGSLFCNCVLRKWWRRDVRLRCGPCRELEDSPGRARDGAHGPWTS